MSKKEDPDFVNYIQRENTYADAFMADTRELQRSIHDSITRGTYEDVLVSSKLNGSWFYWEYIPEGKESPVINRELAEEKEGSVSKQVLVDFNQSVTQKGYIHVKWKVTPDNRYLVYTFDTVGDERYVLQIRDLQNNCNIVKEIKNVFYFDLTIDSCYLFYTVFEENKSQFRPNKLQLTKLGSDDDDVIIYTENDSRFLVNIHLTADGKFVTVGSCSRTSTEKYVLNANEPLRGLRVVHKRVPGVKCFLEHHRGFFYLLTNAPVGDGKSTSGKFYLARCRVEDVESNIWQIVIQPSEDVSLKDFDMFNEHMVLSYNKSGSRTLCSIKMPIDLSSKKHITNIDDLDPWYFPIPSVACTIARNEVDTHNFMHPFYCVVVSSPLMPHNYVYYDMSRNRSSLDGEEDLLREYSDKYSFEKKEVISHDGVRIPLTILYSRTMYKKGMSPGLLHGYGAGGIDCPGDSWDSFQSYLLDAGWVIAFADVRGGSGVDPSWHKNGSGLNKMNSIKDFVACGEYLINEGYVHEHRLGAIGASAGGLLVGAAINTAPHLFRAAVLEAPFLDVCNTLMDPTLPLTIIPGYEELGNPEIKSEFESIMSYSPYDNIREGVCYPSMLVTTSFHDARVGVWESAKWVAKVRESSCTNSSSVVLKTSMVGGHLLNCYYLNSCRERAYVYAFLMKVMGMCDVET